MAREDNMKKKIKKFAEGGYQGREGQKALDLDKLPSLNVNTGTQMSAADQKFFKDSPRLYDLASKASQIKATPGNPGSYLAKLFGYGIMKNPGSFRGTLTDNATGKVIRQYKKGGKVKDKRKPIDGIAKSGKTRAKHRKDR